MISTGRCNGVVGRTVAMPSECRIVNGGSGYVNHCEMALDDKNEMVMAASVTTASGDQTAAADVTTILESDYKNKCTENVGLKEWMIEQFKMMEKKNLKIARQGKEIKQAKLEIERIMKQRDELIKSQEELIKERDKLMAKLNAVIPPTNDECMDVMPFTPQSSTCSSGMVDLCSAELSEQQDKPQRPKRNRQAVNQPNPDLLEPSHQKQLRKRSTRAKHSDVGKMLDVSLITSDTAYYTCLGNYDPIKEDPVLKKNVLEIPKWREVIYTSWYSMEGTENMSDDIYENRHSRLEGDERKRKRWDLQNLRDMHYKEHLLKNGKKKRNCNQDDKEELTTLLPNPDNIIAIEITDKLPVSAFGVNLHTEKDEPFLKFFSSNYKTDEDLPVHCAPRELRSSGCKKFFSST